MFNLIKKEIKETELLFKELPTIVVTLFALSVVVMNLLANKTILQTEYLALDGGFLASWLSFLCMDIITMRFGPKASTKVAIFALLCNLLTCFIFYICAIIPSSADDYTVFNSIFAGTWFILLGSSIAFIVSAFINNIVNYLIGKLFKDKDSKLAYVSRSYISTFIGQFVDNLLFAVIVFMIFAPIYWDGFSWTLIQCLTCALTGAVFELLMEIIFSPFGYKISQKWKEENVGANYLKVKGI